MIEPDNQCCITRTTSPRDGVPDLPGTRHQSPITSVPAPTRAIRWLLITLGVLILLLVAPAQTYVFAAPRVPENATVRRDLPYVTNGHMRQKLDLYLPKDGKNLPLIINIHGGAFRVGSKEMGVPLDYLARGYAVASINYRLSQHARFPAQIEDCKAAVRWRRANAAKFNLDPDHFAA